MTFYTVAPPWSSGRYSILSWLLRLRKKNSDKSADSSSSFNFSWQIVFYNRESHSLGPLALPHPRQSKSLQESEEWETCQHSQFCIKCIGIGGDNWACAASHAAKQLKLSRLSHGESRPRSAEGCWSFAWEWWQCDPIWLRSEDEDDAFFMFFAAFFNVFTSMQYALLTSLQATRSYVNRDAGQVRSSCGETLKRQKRMVGA